MKKRIFNRAFSLFIFLFFLLPTILLASFHRGDYLATVKLNIMAYVSDNNFLLQCIIGLLLVMIFGYSAKLLYEKRINKE